MKMPVELLALVALLSASAPAFPQAEERPPASGQLPPELIAFIEGGHHLPKFHEAYYHPLGRSGVVDAVLADPFYLPVFAMQLSSQLRDFSEAGFSFFLFHSSLDAVGLSGIDALAVDFEVGELPGLDMYAPGDTSYLIELAWARFLQARRLSGEALSALTPEEREWLVAHPDVWFFGEEGGDEYDFFTVEPGEGKGHLYVFQLAAKVDMDKLARAAATMTLATENIQSAAGELRGADFRYEFEQDGARLLISGAGGDRHEEDVDFLIDLGGDDLYLNNAGGTRGVMDAALCVDLGGRDRYEGTFATQGAGFLGVGGLLDVSGDDLYSGTNFAQGAGWFGCGFLFDSSGDDRYQVDHFGQGAAAFGVGVLWDREGGDSYFANGFAQAASSTLGSAFLLDAAGNDAYRVGGPRDSFWSRSLGIGQGAAVGVREYPWTTLPAFYGGFAMLDDAAGDDEYYGGVFVQGAGYCLGAGVLLDGAGNDRYIAEADAHGSSIHLSAGLIIDESGDDVYDGGWGSGGVGGDRGVGIALDFAGDDTYRGTSHNLGTARKPKAVGLFVDIEGDDRYEFSGESNAHVQRPSDNESWPFAMFVDLGGEDVYALSDDGIKRGDDMTWGFEGAGTGIDMQVESTEGLVAELYEALAHSLDSDPLFGVSPSGPSRRLASTPIVDETWPQVAGPTVEDAEGDDEAEAVTVPLPAVAIEWIGTLRTLEFPERRQAYERLDLLRFSHPNRFDWSPLARLLADPAAPEDLLAFAAVWCGQDKTASALDTVAAKLVAGEYAAPYSRRLIVRMVGQIAGESALAILSDRLQNDANPLSRREAARYLGTIGTPESLKLLLPAAADESSVVRASACKGLRDTDVEGALEVLLPLLKDTDLYVHRGAALAAISYGYEPAIGVLLESMNVPTLDTGENYGRNLFADLTKYVGEELGEELGIDLEAWQDWWSEAQAGFALE